MAELWFRSNRIRHFHWQPASHSRNGDSEVGDGEVVVGRQVLLRLRGYISVCPALQLSHNDVLGVGLGWVLQLGAPESFPHN